MIKLILKISILLFALPTFAAHTVQWSGDRNSFRLNSDSFRHTWPQVWSIEPKCNGDEVHQGVVCHGEVVEPGKTQPEHIYCIGDVYGCPTAAVCLDMYRKSLAQSGSSSQISLTPLPKGAETSSKFSY